MGSVLNGKRILAVDDEPDILTVLEDEIVGSYPNCIVEKATTYQEASEKMLSRTYDLVILDIMGVRGFDLLETAIQRNFPVAMLTAHALNPEALKKSFEMQARTYLPKEKLGELISFFEDILELDYLSAWKRLFEKLKRFFDQRFEKGWEEKVRVNWQRRK